MAIASATFIAGPYTATYNDGSGAGDLGLTEDGYQISITYAKELIQQTDRFGDTVIDAVYRGVSAVTLTAVGLEWKASAIKAFLPYQGTPMTPTGATYFDIGTVGLLDSTVGGVVILSAVSGTTAHGGGTGVPSTLTATYAVVQENQALQWALTSRLRKFPLPFRLYPYTDTQNRFFTAT